MKELVLTGPSGQEFVVGVLQDEYVMAVEHGKPKTTHLYDHRFLDYMADLIMERPRHKFATNIMVAGEPRTGKSTLASALARKVDPAFPPSKVGFTLNEFMEIFAANPYADPARGIIPQAIADESGF
jgi:DNA polymerase III delta prime subunit